MGYTGSGLRSIREKISTLEKEFNYKLAKHNAYLRTKYHELTCELDVDITHRQLRIFKRNYKLPSIDLKRFSEHIDKISNDIVEFNNTFKDLVERYRVKTDAHLLGDTPFKFTGYSIGECKYQSLGYTQYAFLKLESHLQPMWAKVYFNRSKIKLDKTESQMEKSWDQIADVKYISDTPPRVYFVHEDHYKEAMRFISEHQDELYNKMTKLPLNKVGIREDKEFTYVVIMRSAYGWSEFANTKDWHSMRRGHISNSSKYFDPDKTTPEHGQKCLIPCTSADLAKPDSDLYIVVSNPYTQTKVKGFAKSIKRDERPFELLHGPSYINSQGGIQYAAQNSVLNGYRNFCNTFIISDEINTKDEYMEIVMDKMIENSTALKEN